MKTLGIIAEFNPFHSGHRYLIETAMQKCGADRCIVVMSGDFVQRGAPAIIDCHTRAEMALSGGASAVLSLNPYVSTGSAAYFADGAVQLLDNLGCVDYLAFGSESGDIEWLDAIASILINEPEEYKIELNDGLSQGLSFPVARQKALEKLCDADAIGSPNNILAIEYLSALKRHNSRVFPITITRKGSAYHDDTIDTDFASASALRVELLKNNKNLSKYLSDNSLSILSSAALLDSNDFSRELIYALRTNLEILDEFYDMPAELADRIKNNIDNFKNFDDFCALLKTKDRTYTSISRALIHILLNLKNTETEMSDTVKPHYARIIGFNSAHSDILGKIKSNTNIPLIINAAEASKMLNQKALRSFNEEIRSAHIYQSVAVNNSGQPFKNEYRRKIVKI
ncbi:MAG: nucleotidyltransferase family protein [Lachnospiraceae bacterium]|nr:nucleotidyltransferase family protein [Lachnospiraceae bacterium]